MTSIKHDIWQDTKGLTMLCLAGALGEESRTTLDSNSKIIHSFYADSHYEAMSNYYEFMGWGTYETDYEIDKLPYNLNKISFRESVRLQIDKILWEDWDPIGVNGLAPRDEYHRYVPQILNLTLQNRSINEISNYLYQLETVTIGVNGDRNRCMEIAKKIKCSVNLS